MDIFTYYLVSAILILAILYFFQSRNDRTRSLINQFPGPKSYPLLGTTLPVLLMKKDETFGYTRSLVKNFGPIYRTWIGRIPVVHITDPQHVELILGNSVHISKGGGYKFILPWLGDGLLTSKGTKWHRHRKLLTPAFHFKILESFMPVFVEKSKTLVNILDREANGKPFNIFPYITLCALDIICETAMGIQVNAMSQKRNKYVQAVYGACEEIVTRISRMWLHTDFVYYKTANGKKFSEYLSILHGTTHGVIRERKEALSKRRNLSTDLNSEDDLGMKKRAAFLDLLLEVSKDGTGLTDEQIREEVDTFMFEGHDTTTASICWTIFLLGLHPDIQEKTYKEVSQVLDDDNSIKFNDLNELKYLERVIKESLRLYPSVGGISRFATQDIKIDEYTIPAGATVSIHIYDIHRNEKYFPNPGKFDPDRFSQENSKNRHPYAFIPFSAGPRNCIGQRFALSEEKVVLSYIIKNFKITSVQTVDNINPISELILRPFSGIDVVLEKRL